MRPGYAGICITDCWYHTSLVLFDSDEVVVGKWEYSFVYEGHHFCPLLGPDGNPSQGNMDRMSGAQTKTPVIWRNDERELCANDERLIGIFPVADVDAAAAAVGRFAYEFDSSSEKYHILTRNCRTFVARALVEACGVPPAEVHAAFAEAGARIGVCSVGAYCPPECTGKNTRGEMSVFGWADFLVSGIFRADAVALLSRALQFMRWIGHIEPDLGTARPLPDQTAIIAATAKRACAYSAPGPTRNRRHGAEARTGSRSTASAVL